MSDSKKSLSKRRNFTLSYKFHPEYVPSPTSDEGTPTPSPTTYVPFSCLTSDEGTPPPTQRRKVGEEEQVESGEEEEQVEEGGASPPWCGIREKYLQYDVPYVQSLGEDDLSHLHQLRRWYFPDSCPRTQEEWDYVEGVRRAVNKRLLQLRCNCFDCKCLLDLVLDDYF